MKLPWDKSEHKNGPPADAPAEDGEHSFATLQPGDAISFWGEGDKVVTCVFDCREGIGERSYTWRWIFLDDGSLLEHSPDGRWRYAEHQIIPQGSSLFSDLVGPGGMLEVFEARVRNDTVGDDPVFVELRERRYRVTSTGTVEAQRRGSAPGLGPWTQLLTNAEENIYFSLVAADDEENGVLGLWTSHVCLSFGKPVTDTDVTGIYPRGGR